MWIQETVCSWSVSVFNGVLIININWSGSVFRLSKLKILQNSWKPLTL